ncbi:unnamed protein product, partial [Vitis vinifera]|uniref:Uncharacterized protein n=1 Tax=Vitis vinifera TaxID=29760 RepID=D7TZA7_VITVI
MISAENSFRDGGDEAVTSHGGGFGCGGRFLHPKGKTIVDAQSLQLRHPEQAVRQGPLAWGISPLSMNRDMALLQHGKWMTTTQQPGFAFFANSDQIILSW